MAKRHAPRPMSRFRDSRQLPRMPVCVIFILLVFSGCCLNAQTQEQSSIDVSYLSVSDGMASAIVRNVFQDSYGFLWFATNNGLQKYDGYGFQTFKHDGNQPGSIANNELWHVTEDKEHNLWVSHGEGVSMLDRKTGQLKKLPVREIVWLLC